MTGNSDSWIRYDNLVLRRTDSQALRLDDPEGGHISLAQNGFVSVRSNHARPASGWKLHISVASDQLPQAWDAIAGYLLKRDALPAKVADAEVAALHGLAEHAQAGKMIAIQDSGQGSEWWNETLQEIEALLLGAGIAAGHGIKSDRRIFGSDYCYYCNDRSRNGAYKPAKDRVKNVHTPHKYNPYGFMPDPFLPVDVSDAHPPRQKSPSPDSSRSQNASRPAKAGDRAPNPIERLKSIKWYTGKDHDLFLPWDGDHTVRRELETLFDNMKLPLSYYCRPAKNGGFEPEEKGWWFSGRAALTILRMISLQGVEEAKHRSTRPTDDGMHPHQLIERIKSRGNTSGSLERGL